MATLLDLGLLEYFIPAFVWVFVYVIIWALLQKTKFFGKDNELVNHVISFCVATLFVIVPELITIVQLITPWFIVFLLFLIFLVLLFVFMGVKLETVGNVFSQNPTVFWALLIVSLGIFGYAFTQVYGDAIHDITAGETDDGTGDLTQSIGAILFTPKVLGMVFLLVMAGLVVRFVSASASPGKG